MSDLIVTLKEISNLGLSLFIAVYFIIRLDRFMVKILFELKKINGKGGDSYVIDKDLS